MTRIFTLIILTFSSFVALADGLSFSGSPMRVISEKPISSSGLNYVWIIYGCSGVSAHYIPAKATNTVKWFRFGEEGASSAVEVQATVGENGASILSTFTGDCGYVVEEHDGDRVTACYFWIVDYSRHPFICEGIQSPTESGCGDILLTFDGEAARLTYHSVSGRSYEIDRGISLTYTTLVEKDARFVERTITKNYPFLHSTIAVPASLCDTRYEISGDRFLEEWGMKRQIYSDMVRSTAVSAIVEVTDTDDKAPNQSDSSSEFIGGSAPAEIKMEAQVTQAAIFTEWQISRDPEFSDIALRINEPSATHTFRETGTWYLRFYATNESATCEYLSETVTIAIGESHILCPNAFTPSTSPGINDEWRVSYSSLTEFDCYIFNRWGEKLAEFHDPAQGWDGKHHGRYVAPGVYYYVIEALGADGKVYRLSGDINIIGYKTSINQQQNNENK